MSQTRDQHLQTIREACIKVSPNGQWKEVGSITNDADGNLVVNLQDRRIRLADVLLAIWQVNPANRTNVVVESAGTFVITSWHGVESSRSLGPEWNLPKDDLTQQSDECLAFLADLLTA
jgi:hypothetical protein